MSRHAPLRRALALAAVLAALVPGAAHAKVTRSSVTAPASPVFPYWDESVGTPSLTVAATTDGVAGDLVDLVCTHGATASLQFKDIPVGADGAVTTRVGFDELPRIPCVYRFVPVAYRGPDFSAFAGALVAATAYYPFDVAIHATTRTAPVSFVLESANLRGVARAGSAGDHGLAGLHGVRAGTLEAFAYPTWNDGAALTGNRERPGIMVDGRTAYAAAEVPRFDFDGPEGSEGIRAPSGFAGVVSSVRHDGKTGAVTITESQSLQRCARIANEETPTPENCALVVSTGVRLERTIALTAAHAVADIRDRWISADGRPHSVAARYTTLAPAKIEAPLWRFPGDPVFTPRGPGEVLVPRAPGTALTKEDEVKAGPLRAAGAFSYAPAAAVVTFGADTVETVVMTVPADGAAPVRRAFAVGDDVTEAQRHGRRVEDSFSAPRLTLSATPSTTARTTVVRGRATDNVGVTALTVGGRRVLPAADGSFAVTVGLAGGANAIVATAADGSGLSASARTVVSRICRVPKVRRGVRVTAARAALDRAGCTARKRTTRVRSKAVRRGRVIGFTRRPGTVLRGGAVVGIRVSSGRKVGGIRN